MKNNTPSIIKTVTLAMLTAISFVLYLWEIPMIPSLNYLKLDLSDIPALVGALYIGPFAGVVIEFLKNLIDLLTRGLANNMGYGDFMNFLVGSAYILPFTLVFNRLKKTRSKVLSAVLASVTGLVSIIVIGLAGNYLIAPFFFENFMHVTLTKAELKNAIMTASILNVFKGGILTAVSFPIIFALLNRIKKTGKS